MALVCDRPLDAIAHARAALAALPAQPNSEKARARAALGEAFIALGDQASGLAELNSAAETLTEVGSSREAAQVWRQLAELYAALNAASQALAAYAHAMDAVGVRGDALDRRLQHAIQVGPASSGAGPDDEARQPARA